MKKPLLEFTDKGIYCSAAKVYLDPWKPVNNAIISHGHADHSRYGHKQYITHHRNVPIISHRLGDINVTGKEFQIMEILIKNKGTTISRTEIIEEIWGEEEFIKKAKK